MYFKELWLLPYVPCNFKIFFGEKRVPCPIQIFLQNYYSFEISLGHNLTANIYVVYTTFISKCQTVSISETLINCRQFPYINTFSGL